MTMGPRDEYRSSDPNSTTGLRWALAVVSVIAVGELAHASMTIRSQTFRVLEMLTAMAVIYWMLGYPQAKLVDWIREKYKVNE